MSPEQFEEYGPDDEDQEEEQDAKEWQPGECDMCAGPPKTDAEKKAVLASAFVPVCACWVGQGASSDECLCSPDLFEDEAPAGETPQHCMDCTGNAETCCHPIHKETLK